MVNEHLESIWNGLESILDKHCTVACVCINPNDPGADYCPACVAWIDFADELNALVEKYESGVLWRLNHGVDD